MAYQYVTVDGQRVERNVAEDFFRMNEAFQKAFPGIRLVVTSGTRTDAEQERIFRDRYVLAGDVRGRRVYDTRWWNGRLWYRISPAGTVAVPGTSNHQESGPNGPRSIDIRDTGRDAGVTVRGTARDRWMQQNAGRFEFENEGYNFREPWHKTNRGQIGVYGGGSGGGSSVSQDTKNRQGWLNEARGEKLAVDGIQGPATTAAIKRYQDFLNKRYGTKLAVDGIWGPETQKVHQRYWDELKKPKPQPAQERPNPWSVVKGWNWNGIAAMLRRYYGYRGNNVPGPQMVSALQRFLKAKYGYTGAIDGIFGDGTAAAVQRWLKAKWNYTGAIDSWMGSGTHEAWKRAEVANWHAFPGHRQ